MELFYSTDIRFGKKSCTKANAGKDLDAVSTDLPKSVVLTGSEAEHCAKVLRHKEGDLIFVIDGLGGLYNCRITRMDLPKKGEALVECEVLEKSFGVGKRNYRLVMAVCPTKNIDRYEWFVEKATELGVDVIVPLISDHSIRTSVKKERLEALALSATKQSLKSYLPKIADCISVTDFLNNPNEADSLNGDVQKDTVNVVSSESRNLSETEAVSSGNEYDSTDGDFSGNLKTYGKKLKLIAHCEEGDKKTIRQYLAELKGKDGSAFGVCGKDDSAFGVCGRDSLEQTYRLDVVVMIGPEGDFSQREIEFAMEKGFLPATLGESRLRVETAAVACVSEVYFASQEMQPPEKEHSQNRTEPCRTE